MDALTLCDLSPVRKANTRDWIKLVLSILCSALATIIVSLVIYPPGDCGPEVTNCDGTRPYALAVLGLGAAWIVYLLARFLRRQHRP